MEELTKNENHEIFYKIIFYPGGKDSFNWSSEYPKPDQDIFEKFLKGEDGHLNYIKLCLIYALHRFRSVNSERKNEDDFNITFNLENEVSESDSSQKINLVIKKIFNLFNV